MSNADEVKLLPCDLDNATAEQIERANEAVAANMIDEWIPRYASAQGYACALTAIMLSDARAIEATRPTEQSLGVPFGPGHSRAEPEEVSALRASVPNALLAVFVRESNYIEGIRETTDAHVGAHQRLLAGPLHIPALIELVSVLQPNARFRNAVNIPGVRVGNHVAPPSGPDIEGNLRSILAMRDPWEQHIAYETLHPFTDGNGRSGRAVWLHRHWHEEDLDAWAIRRGFLHSWYYHTLSSVRPASAIEARRAADSEAGVVHESAGPKDDAHE